MLLAAAVALTVVAAGCDSDNASGTPPSGGTPSVGNTSPGGVLSETQLRNLASFVSGLSGGAAQQSGIWVTGTGEVTADPDLALLTLGVETHRDTVAAARDDAARAMSGIAEALRRLGIAGKDIQTRYFSIQPEYRYDELTRRQVLTGYRVSNTVTVQVRNLDRVSEVIDASASAGGDSTRIQGIQFTVEDTAALETQAREKAVKDALAKARQFAALTGVQVGKLVSIAESGGSMPQPVREFLGVAKDSAGGAPTPISPGQLEVRVSVQAVFTIQ